MFTKPCTADLYIYRETPFNCPCTCLLLQFQKLTSCGFHFFLGLQNGFTTEITPASHPTYMIESVLCHHGFIAALQFHTRRRRQRLRVMSWAEIKSTKSILKRAEYQPYTILFCLMNIIDIGKYRAVTNLNGPPGGANWIFSLVNKETIKEQTWFFKKGKLQIH